MVKVKVCLGPGRANRRPFLRVEFTELDSGFIGVFGHFSAESIYFFHQMALGKTADGRIAGHPGDAV
jgi:hypothetical protein